MKRRAMLTHEIEETHDRLRQMVIDLENLDATLLQFDPRLEIETIKPRAFRPPAVWRAANEMIEMFGDDAAIRAAMQADAALDVGDTADFSFWKRVVASINDLSRAPTNSEPKN
jgi:hypothetical protein